MNEETKAEIEKLAYHIWRSAGEEYGRAIDFWLMAETMVLELTASATRFTQDAMSTAAASASLPPVMRNAYIQHITMLANAMWQASGAQMGSALDFWLAAERHVRVLTERAARAAGASVGADEAVARMFDSFSPEAYLDEIRRIAYGIWETAGHQYGSALDIWLAAERQFLETHVAIAPVRPSAARKKWNEAAAPEAVAEPPRKPAKPPAGAVETAHAAPKPQAQPAPKRTSKPKAEAKAADKPKAAPKPGSRKSPATQKSGGKAPPRTRGPSGGTRKA